MVAAELYPLPVWSADELMNIRADATREATAEKSRRHAGGPAVGGGAAPQPAAGQQLAVVDKSDVKFPPGAREISGEEGVWVAGETDCGFRFGDKVQGVQAAAVIGAKCLHSTSDGKQLFCVCINEGLVSRFNARPSECDGRILPRKMNVLGAPEMSLSDMVSKCHLVDMGWRVAGPKTTKWCLNYLSVEGLGLEGHHERFRQLCRLETSSWGVMEHFQVSMFLRNLLQVDMLDGMNCQGIELMFRRLQTIEYAHSERAREIESKNTGGKLSLEEQASFGSVVRQSATLMIAPDLLTHVKEETERDAALQKNLRKAREERELWRKQNKSGEEDRGGPLSSPGPVGMRGNPQADYYVPFFQQTDGRVVQRDIFPLPSCGPRGMLGGSDVCRSVQRRLQKACHIDSMVEDCICALNAMYSNGRVEKAKTGSALSLAQCEVVRHLRNSMQMLGPCPQGLTGAEAVSQLRAFDGYGEDQCPASIAAYSPELLDLKDAFYHFELPAELRPFFTMRGVAAGEVGVSEIEIAVAPGQKIYPRLKVLPMGWSHALWWCQVIHQRIVSTIGATSPNCLEDKAAAPSSRCCHLEYVDNFVVIGASEDEVCRMADSGVNALRSKGLVVHDEEKISQQIAVLGWEFDYSIFKPKSKRVWRVRRAFEYFLNKGMISGRQLEKVVGHATFLCLGRRKSLAVFGETYTFIHRHYHRPHRIWKSVRREMAFFVCICSNDVVAVDASHWGLGATISTFSTDDVADLGRFSERWRFGVDQFAKPRASAFGADIAADSEEPWASHEANAENEAPSGLEPLTVNPEKPIGEIFQQVPFSCVDRSWKVCGRFKWKRQEPIPVLESRASLFAVKHLLRSCHSFNRCHLILSDSISAVCALDRGRGRSFKMRRVTQQIGALILASNTSFSYRWIPSEWNPVDGPSRGSRFASVPSRFPDNHDTQVLADWNRAVSSQEDMQHQEEGNSSAVKKDTRLGLIDGLEVRQGEGCDSAGGWKSPKCFRAAELQEKVRRVLGEVPKTSMDEIHCQFPARDGRSEVGTAFLDVMFAEGEDLGQAQYMVAAVQFKLPHERSPRQMKMPMTRQAMQGWRKMDPRRSRLPLPWEVVCLMMKYCMQNQMIQEALMMALCFVCYLRPGKVTKLRVMDLVAPVGRRMSSTLGQ